MVTGVSKGFTKRLEIRGVGFRASRSRQVHQPVLGCTHPIHLYTPPTGVTVKMRRQREDSGGGRHRQMVGQEAATIRAFRPPEPYKGKGVRYMNEVVVPKEGKKRPGGY